MDGGLQLYFSEVAIEIDFAIEHVPPPTSMHQKILDAIGGEIWCIRVATFIAILTFNNQLGGDVCCHITRTACQTKM